MSGHRFKPFLSYFLNHGYIYAIMSDSQSNGTEETRRKEIERALAYMGKHKEHMRRYAKKRYYKKKREAAGRPKIEVTKEGKLLATMK